ncbi:MAG TPA: hypothetical protein VKV29_04975 [Chthonomonas sp.]|jgi:hypothetical protein|uniref:hypothetical protein n=1 Tax=Chthonomonas sp. TaxID=2282153 RepID=UPI002B4AC6DB|nr:hypothetical protein [Chthonomonas sp.]HLH79618.1 hypothetical protein [Chthonomonas sp.]
MRTKLSLLWSLIVMVFVVVGYAWAQTLPPHPTYCTSNHCTCTSQQGSCAIAPGCLVLTVPGNSGGLYCCILCGGQTSPHLYSVNWSDYFCYQDCGDSWVYVGCYYDTNVTYIGPCTTTVN